MKLLISVMTFPKNLWRRFAIDRTGITTVEFAVGIPIFTALVVGAVQGGLLLFDEIELANAAVVGSRTFAVARQPSCLGCTAQPYTSTIDAIANAGGLELAAANVALAVGGTPCISDAACLSALNGARSSGAHYSPSSQTSVTVTYACPRVLPSALFDVIGACPGGSLSFKLSQQVQ